MTIWPYDGSMDFKIVFYGPEESGKTTAIYSLFKKFNQKSSIGEKYHRLKHLDWNFGKLVIKSGIWDIHINLWSATDQSPGFKKEECTALGGVDGILFLIDSRREFLKINEKSWKLLVNHYGRKLGTTLPVIICMNKQDLGDLVSIEEFQERLRLPDSIELVKMVANRGGNVQEAFSMLFQEVRSRIVENVSNFINRYFKVN